MKRKEFFKMLGLGVAAVVVAPKAIASVIEEVKDDKRISLREKSIPMDNYFTENPKTYKEAFRRNELAIPRDTYKHTGKITPIDVAKIEDRLQETFGDQSLQQFLRHIGKSKI